MMQVSEAGVSFSIPDRNEGLDPIPASQDVPKRTDPVFFNPKQALNRDISLLVLHAWREVGYLLDSVAEPFAGSGVRSLRYALQGPPLTDLYVSDKSSLAIQTCQENFARHQGQVEGRGTHVHFSELSFRAFLHTFEEEKPPFDFVDVDPFGTPQPFVRDALRYLRKPGLIALTATDMPTITGIYPDKTYKTYQAPAFKVRERSYCHEIGLRMFLAWLQREGLAIGLVLTPVLSYFKDHYIRVFARRERHGRTGEVLQSHGYVIDCRHCGGRTKVLWQDSLRKPTACQYCGQPGSLLGPLFLGPLHDLTLVSRMADLLPQLVRGGMIDRHYRLKRFFPLLQQDLVVDSPWFFDVASLGKRYNVRLPSPQEVIDVLVRDGWEASLTHFSGQGLKTNFPLDRELPPEFAP